MRVPLACLALLVASGCLTTDDDAAVTLTVAPQSATLDGVVAFTLRLEVTSTATFTHRGCPPELLDASVRISADTSVPLYTYGEEPMASACATRSITLEPSTIERVVHWNGARSPNAPEPHTGAQVAAGAYEVVARFAVTDATVTATATVRVP